MGSCDTSRCVFPLTSLQIGDLQSYLSHLSLFLPPESNKFYILVDNWPWLEGLGSRPAHLWQLMVTKSRLSPFANTRVRKGGKDCRETSEKKSGTKGNSSKPEFSSRWLSLINAATLSQKKALIPMKKLKYSLQFNHELHRTLFGLIVFEVQLSNIRGINYLNELQTDTSLVIETKYMKRWEFDSILQAVGCLSSWFSGTHHEQNLLREHLLSTIGIFEEEVFYDAPEQKALTRLSRGYRRRPRSVKHISNRSISMASKDKKTLKGSSSRGAGGIRTLADLNRRSGPDSDSDSDGTPQEYYTGGEKSGMLVQDPSKDSSKENDVDEIFNKARQQGAVEGPIGNLHPSSSSRSFVGTGRLLSGETVPAAPQQPESVVHNIVFWRNGFTINDGPLRRLDDPENAAFLESIRKSECPKELEPADRRSSVHVNLIRREEDCPEPEARTVPFQGVGRTLGGSSSEPTPSAATPFTSAQPPSMGLVVDESVPSTSIQLRLADGTRMVTHFNYHHTINDIRAFIDSSRPGASRSYQLQTVGFPPKQLNDLNQTIEQAGLANSVVIQKL